MNANKFYIELIKKNPRIEVVRTFNFYANNKIQDRNKSLTLKDKFIVNECLKVKKHTGLSFWESLFEVMKNGLNVRSSFMKNAIFHNENTTYNYFLRDDILDYLGQEIEGDVAINSKVIMDDGSELHIPMLDFKLKSCEHNVEIIEKVIKVLDLHGYILNSGKSYHFIGYNLITENELLTLLAKFILLHPISDKAWASHQIIERSASLRLSKKYGHYPSFVKKIGD